jgi:hypothetical protein
MKFSEINFRRGIRDGQETRVCRAYAPEWYTEKDPEILNKTRGNYPHGRAYRSPAQAAIPQNTENRSRRNALKPGKTNPDYSLQIHKST